MGLINDQYQDVIGQFPFLKAFSHVVLGFTIEDDGSATRDAIITALQDAVHIITTQVPWLGNTIAHEGSGPGNTGTFKLAPWPAGAPANKTLRVKYCDDEIPSFQELLDAGAPISMLDGSKLAPYPGLPLGYEESESNPAPVALFQANFVKGGLILTCTAHHNIIDAGGMLQLYNLLAAAMQDNRLPDKLVEAANLDRTRVIPLLGPGDAPMKDHSHLKRPPLTNGGAAALPKPKYTWSYFQLRRGAVSAIKELASSNSEGYDKSVPFVSSNDALSALYWQRIAATRLERKGPSAADTLSKYGRAIDVRRTMAVPAEYLGHMVYHSATRIPLGELVEMPLAAVACRLRQDLVEANTVHNVRSYATFISREPDKGSLLYGGPYDPDVDVACSAVTQGGFLSSSFGPLLGVPRFFRKPDFAPLPGCVYFTPPEEGRVMVLVCLIESDLEALKADREWTKYAEFLG